MFQSFDPVSDRSFASSHLPLLRHSMATQKLDGFIVPHDDEYLNEYLPDCAERLMWVSGFSGSAGAAIILLDQAVMFTDGRYTLQVREQVDENFFSFEDITDTPPSAWLADNGKPGARIGYDPMLHSPAGLEALVKASDRAGFVLVPVTQNPIDVAWTDRPAPPVAPTVPHDNDYAGKSSQEKRREIAAAIKKAGADTVVLTAPHSLAWLFNIRGKDVHATPLPLGRAILHSDGTAALFLHPEKVDDTLRTHLTAEVSIHPETEIAAALAELGENSLSVMIDPALAPVWFFDQLQEAGAEIIKAADPCALPRARKNKTEMDGTRRAHIRDGIAVSRFLHWVAEDAQSGDVTEIEAAQKLESFRAMSNQLNDISFDSISAAGSNGAHCHYRVTTETNKKLERGTLYLIDSGGQYPDGTTDITRTVPIGEPTEEMRRCYTLVLKGHISLATIRFPRGTSGHQLDVLARRPLWEAGLDYDHGTGHGVGSYLGVHEGPQNISKKLISQPLEPGMICSNEPGYYKTGEFGIRIENLVIVRPPVPVAGGEREMMSFEIITMAPLERTLIDTSLLTEDEIAWVNDYHAEVFQKLSEGLEPDLSAWLKEMTAPL
ncbi:aminopeptidase P family protein [Parvularcula sp. IMCC14364]|uniref:aminopeptidase P family protein n=1 Tax=Parvularcula sp. IMCC14364 TaxID=3067902 RepID=UPI002741600C|nr:aminopeptidase P family protein [Parvularcula sp. IMCC14364]